MVDFLKTLVTVFVKSVPDTSPVGTVDKIDWAKTLRSVALYGVGAAVAELGRQLEIYDAGSIELLVAAVIGFAGELVTKAIKANETPKVQ